MSSRKIILSLFALLLLVFAPLHPAAAQDQTPQVRITQVDNSKFPLVTVYVSVTNAAGEPVGVDPNQIQILENGSPVQIQQAQGVGASGSDTPTQVTTMLVMDISGSMNIGGKLEAAKAAAHAYVALMRPGDQAGLISFNTEVKVVQPITSDHAVLDQAIDSLNASDDTAMYDALMKAVDTLQPVSGRKAIIVLTDGLDNRSNIGADEVISAVGPGGLSISTIGLGDPASLGTNFGIDEAGLKSLAERAGGVFGYAQDAASLQNLYETYGRALQSEYAITYTSPSSLRDGVNRALTVTLGGGQTSATAKYNPGGVLPEVTGKPWLMFGGILAALLILAVLPGLIGLFAKKGGKQAPKSKSRIKLK